MPCNAPAFSITFMKCFSLVASSAYTTVALPIESAMFNVVISLFFLSRVSFTPLSVITRELFTLSLEKELSNAAITASLSLVYSVSLVFQFESILPSPAPLLNMIVRLVALPPMLSAPLTSILAPSPFTIITSEPLATLPAFTNAFAPAVIVSAPKPPYIVVPVLVSLTLSSPLPKLITALLPLFITMLWLLLSFKFIVAPSYALFARLLTTNGVAKPSALLSTIL